MLQLYNSKETRRQVEYVEKTVDVPKAPKRASRDLKPSSNYHPTIFQVSYKGHAHICWWHFYQTSETPISIPLRFPPFRWWQAWKKSHDGMTILDWLCHRVFHCLVINPSLGDSLPITSHFGWLLGQIPLPNHQFLCRSPIVLPPSCWKSPIDRWVYL